MLSELASLWRFRYLTSVLIARNIKLKYQNSALGVLWTILNPLMIVVILLVVFTRVVRIDIAHYWAFLLSGYFAYHFFSQAVLAASGVLDEYAVMVRSVAIPRSTVVLAAVTSRFFDFVLEFALAVAAIGIFHHQGIPIGFLSLPLLMLLLFVLTFGIALMIAALAVFYYDVRHILPIALTALFYASPVFYSVAMIPEEYRVAYYLNPLAVLLDLLHSTGYGGAAPALELLLVSILQVAVIGAAGMSIFARLERAFAEVL